MKNLISFLLIAAFAAIVNTATSQTNQNTLQNKSGVYLSFADFKLHKLHLEVDYTKEKHKIKVHDFINKSDIDVVHQNKKYKFVKKEIYGIRDCKGIDYRFYNDQEYQVIATDTIYIYSKEVAETTSSYRNYQTHYITKYYFSKTGDSEILPLTNINIKKTFPDNHKMHDALDMMFASENELTAYDDFHKTYKIIRFLKENLK
jgi:hypothetical protein